MKKLLRGVGAFEVVAIAAVERFARLEPAPVGVAARHGIVGYFDLVMIEPQRRHCPHTLAVRPNGLVNVIYHHGRLCHGDGGGIIAAFGFHALDCFIQTNNVIYTVVKFFLSKRGVGCPVYIIIKVTRKFRVLYTLSRPRQGLLEQFEAVPKLKPV